MDKLVAELIAAAQNVSDENLCMSSPALVRLDAAVAALRYREMYPTDGYYEVSANYRTCIDGEHTMATTVWHFPTQAAVQAFKDKGGFTNPKTKYVDIRINFMAWNK